MECLFGRRAFKYNALFTHIIEFGFDFVLQVLPTHAFIFNYNSKRVVCCKKPFVWMLSLFNDDAIFALK